MNVIRRRVLEIGHNASPMKGTVFDLVKKMPPDAEYHGVDLFRPRFMEQTGGLGRSNVFFYLMDACHLAFGNSTFDEVHMHMVPSSNQARSFAWDIAEEAFRVLKSGGRMVVTSEEPGGHSRLLRNLGLKEESLDPVAEKRFREILRGTLTRDPYDTEQDFEGIVGNCPGDMLLLTDTILGKLILDNMHCEFFWLPDAVNVGVKP